MTSQMQTVLWIAGEGGLLLFAAIAGLVGLMYLLTSPLLSFRRSRSTTRVSTDESSVEAEDTEEPQRRKRAAALVVAVACAEADRSPVFSSDDSPSWRLLHRSSRLRQRVVKRGMES
jgi:hypothetical protein